MKHVGKLFVASCILLAPCLAFVPPSAASVPNQSHLAPGALAGPVSPKASDATLSSLAVVPTSKTSADIAGGVDAGPATSATTVTGLAPGGGDAGVRGTAIPPDGSVALVAGFGGQLQVIDNPTTAPTLGTPLSLAQFTAEGNPAFVPSASGVALTPDGSYGLVGIDALGVVQIARSGATYAVDTRIHAAGTNSAGAPHQPGFIPGPDTASVVADSYDGTVISDTPSTDGDYLGLTIDAGAGTVAVVTGVGTPGAAISSTLTSSTLCDRPVASCYGGYGYGYGNGGMAFDPTSAAKAVIATNDGVSVLYLSNPSAPTLGSATTIAAASTGDGAQSVAVGPDSNHVAVAVGDTLYFFTGLASATPGAPLTQSATPMVMPGLILGLDVTRTGNLVVNYTHTATTGDVAVVTGMDTATPVHTAPDLLLSGPSPTTNAMSVWPAVGTATPGYRLTGADGGVYSFDAPFYGSAGDIALAQPVVGMSSTPDQGGYYFVARDGGIFTYGSASFDGSVPGAGVHVSNITGMAVDPATGGYWVVGSDGGVYSFNAPYLGSVPGMDLSVSNIVGIAATPDGGGYWLVGSDGGVFTFGDAQFSGSMGGQALAAPVTGLAVDSATGGYWEVASDGGVFSFDAPYLGSAADQGVSSRVVGIAATADGGGYALADAAGGVYTYGDAGFEGSLTTDDIAPNAPIVGIAAA